MKFKISWRRLERWLDAQGSFELYVLYTSLVIAISYLSGYDIYDGKLWSENYWYAFGPGSVSNVYHVPTFAIDPFAFWNPGPALLIKLQIVGALLIPFRRVRRAGAGLFLAAEVYGLNYYECFSVLTNFYLVFALGLVLFPARAVYAQRGFILGGIAAGWLASAVNKFNFYSLSGLEMRDHLRLISRPYAVAWMGRGDVDRWLAPLGLVCEAAAAMIIFLARPLAVWGLLAALTFSTGIFLQINGGHAVLRFFVGLCFLLGFRWAKGRLFIFLLLWPFAIEALAQSQYLSMILFTSYSLSFALLIGFLIFKSGVQTENLSGGGNRAAVFAGAIVFVIVLATRSLDLPMPMGWTQYSGLGANREARVIFVQGEGSKPIGFYFGNFIFWDLRGLITSAQSFVFASYHSYMVDALLRHLCATDITNIRIAEVHVKWRDFMAESFVRPLILEQQTAAMLKAQPLNCGPR